MLIQYRETNPIALLDANEAALVDTDRGLQAESDLISVPETARRIGLHADILY